MNKPTGPRPPERINGSQLQSPSVSACKGIDMQIQVDTTQLDEAIEKASRLVQLLERADELACRTNKTTTDGKPVKER